MPNNIKPDNTKLPAIREEIISTIRPAEIYEYLWRLSKKYREKFPEIDDLDAEVVIRGCGSENFCRLFGYTKPDGRPISTHGNSFEEAEKKLIDEIGSAEQRAKSMRKKAEKMREEAAKLLAEADALEDPLATVNPGANPA
jgi:hypothetical protein